MVETKSAGSEKRALQQSAITHGQEKRKENQSKTDQICSSNSDLKIRTSSSRYQLEAGESSEVWSGKSGDKATLSPNSEGVSYHVTSSKHTVEYKQFDPNTFPLHYGKITPQGTSTIPKSQSSQDTEGKNPDDSKTSQPLVQMWSMGSEKHQTGFQGITYIDFMPLEKKKGACRVKYFNFSDCIAQANVWLSENTSVDLCRCESVRHRLDYAHTFNPESSVTHDRSYLTGLRLWYRLAEKEKDRSVKLLYKNFLPLNKDDDNSKPSHAKARPLFEDFSTTVSHMNDELRRDPLHGTFLGIEAVSINYATTYQKDGSIDYDVTYCRLPLQEKWEVFVVRLFYIEDLERRCNLQFECVDFAPAPISLTPDNAQFQTMSTLITDSNKWLEKHPEKILISLQTIELSFKLRMLVASKGHINTNVSSFQPTKSSADRDSLKILRLWVTAKPADLKQIHDGGAKRSLDCNKFELLTIVPRQLVASGCCGAHKPIFATHRDTVEKLNGWLHRSGAEIIDIETDNVEKWKNSSINIHTILPERTYNKEDYKSSFQSAVEYRFTMFRVYYKPKNLNHLYSPNQDQPVEPCCCFVGCAIM